MIDSANYSFEDYDSGDFPLETTDGGDILTPSTHVANPKRAESP